MGLPEEGAIGLAMVLWGKISMVSKKELIRHEDVCQSRITKQFEHVNDTVTKVFDKLDDLEKSVNTHHGRVEQFMKDKE